MADVAASDARDLVVTFDSSHLAVIRCVLEPSQDDHIALTTMLSEGTFVWAGLVFEDQDRSETIGLVETFHISELDRLVSRLQQLREAFSEAR